MLTCSQCHQTKPESDFNKSSKSKTGRRSECNECRRVHSREYLELHKEEIHARQREYGRSHSERIVKRVREWDRKHPDRVRTRVNKWKKENKDRFNEAVHKWKQANREHCNSKARARYAKNINENRKYVREWHRNHSAICKASYRRWKANNPDKIALYKIRRAALKAQAIATLTVEQIDEIKRNGCFVCGTRDDLTVAHDVPISKKGNTTRGNTFCLCRKHNSEMGTRTLAEYLEQKTLPLT